MPPKSTNCITFLPNQGKVEVSQSDESILDLALRAKIPINHTCGGNGTCGTCRVIIREGLELLPKRNEIEQEMSEDRGFQESERLACQTPPVEGLTVEVPDASMEK